MENQFQFIQVSQNEFVATITICRPQQLNALNKATILELNNVLNQIQNDNNIRVVIITGSGDKAFVAGADIKEFIDFTPEEGKALAKNGQEMLFDKVANFSKPIIAAINGYALGGGLELALACHVRLASENAKMGLPEVTLGLIPGYGGTQRLAQLVGKGKAFEMILSAKMVDAAEAKNIGLINEITTVENLIQQANELAKLMAKNSPNAIKNAIAAIQSSYSNDGLRSEIDLFGSCFGSDDFIEGTNAFVEKRKPNF
jgi:enoyl-CoA hydratase